MTEENVQTNEDQQGLQENRFTTDDKNKWFDIFWAHLQNAFYS